MNPSRGISLHALTSTLLGSALVLFGVLVCYATLDFTLGLIFAAVIVAMLVSLSLAGGVKSSGELVGMTFALSLCAAIPVLLVDVRFAIPCIQLLAMCMTTALLASAGVYALRALRLPAPFAVTVVMLIAMAWITFPVWVSHLPRAGLGVRVIDLLLEHHPLLALNGAFLSLGDWSHMPIAYRYLTNLGQDVPLALPRTAWPSAALHGIAGIALLGIGALANRGRVAQANAPA